MEKYNFLKEIEKIEEPTIKEFVKESFKIIPDYFWKIPASASGRFHPLDTLGEGGLVTHTKRVFYLAEEIAKIFLLKDEKLDIVRAAALLHDTYKHGPEDKGHGDREHPFYPRKFLKQIAHLTPYFEEIMDVIETHQGRWGIDPVKMPKTREQWALHIADFIASRNFIYVRLDGYKKPEIEDLPYLSHDLENLIKNYLDLKVKRQLIEKKMEEIKKKVLEKLKEKNENKVITKIGVARIIKNIIYKFDKEILAPVFKKMGIWERVVTIDEKKFKKYLSEGIIPKEILQKGVQVVEKESIKIMPREDSPEISEEEN